jgi:hypothetical protein
MSPSELLKGGEDIFLTVNLHLGLSGSLKGYLFFKDNVSACYCIMNKLNMVWIPVPGIMVQVFESSCTRNNILHLFEKEINYKIRDQLIYLVCSHVFLEEVFFLSLLFTLLRWIWINVSSGSILSSLLPGWTVSCNVSILVTSKALNF